ncbi:hypothetical protein MATL_G00036270 [Megalops atlanticus]|uniref:G-protein coupled receptors family 1 profile domain-containing protein n=1 Tax=Megalops atlanticus TaxID=7932 RepID=A0A9D3QFT9_MEGAT|nr:hypothetical protein MATL_G00036270 [Megalops atlanticus]
MKLTFLWPKRHPPDKTERLILPSVLCTDTILKIGRTQGTVMDYDYPSMPSNSTWMYDNDSYDYEYVTLCPKRNVNHLSAVYLPTFYHCIFLLSLLGNGLVLYIIYKYEKLNSMTNIFLLNLVISDLVFASSLPFWATYHASEWIFGSALCKMVSSVYYIGFYSSILFLTLMTLDRYLAVVHALTALKRRRNTYACISSAAVWFVSVLASLKKMILFDVRTDGDAGTLCEETGFSKEVLTRWQLIVPEPLPEDSGTTHSLSRESACGKPEQQDSISEEPTHHA